ncbi:methyltransferase [Shigella flexneri]
MLGPTTTTLAWKKARLINCTFMSRRWPMRRRPVSWKLEGTDWTIHNHANVFSHHRAGHRRTLFMQHLPENLEGEIVDLAAGNGVIGLTPSRKTRRRKWCLSMNRRWRSLPANECQTNMPEALDRLRVGHPTTRSPGAAAFPL